MTWLPSALIATASTALISAFIYFYLHTQERKNFLLYWGIGWAVYSLRFLIQLAIITQLFPHPPLLLAQQAASLLSGIVFLYGSYLFLEKKMPRWLPLTGAGCVAWTGIALRLGWPFWLTDLPTSFFLGGVFAWTGFRFLAEKNAGTGLRLSGWSLVIWGIHKADYPFLRPVVWFAPWGFLLASWLFLITAIGLLLAYAEKIRQEIRAQADALLESQETTRAIADYTYDMELWWGEDGRLLWLSPSTLRITGYSAEECIEVKEYPFSAIHPEDQPAVREKFSTNLQNRGSANDLDFRLQHKNGSYRWVALSWQPIYTSGNRYQGLRGSIRDINARKKAEQEKLKAEEQLRQSQKLEAIGTLAGGIAHDFNNALTAILGYGSLAKHQLPPESPVVGDIDEILVAGNRAKELVRQILTFSRHSGDLRRIPLHMQTVLKETLKLLRASLPTTIEITQSIDPNCCEILADPTHVHQIIMNLCTNAFHAMRESGGTLTVVLKEVVVSQEDAAARLGLLPGKYAHLEVSDNGAGMAPEVLEHIFEPYFTTKEQGEGTGLGLAVVHGIVTSYKGHISVDSEPGRGTTFHVYLPQLSPKTATGPSMPDEAPLAETKGCRILCVDDEVAIGKMLQKTLHSLGHEATALADSVEALNLFRENPHYFDLLITDMTMPRLTGAQLAAEILALRPGFPIILCTGFSQTMDKEAAQKIGIRELVMKPLSQNELARILATTLGQRCAQGTTEAGHSLEKTASP